MKIDPLLNSSVALVSLNFKGDVHKYFLSLLVLFISGCSSDGLVQSLEEYLESTNYVQEQNISTEKDFLEVPPSSSLLSQEGGLESEWAAIAFASRCEWYDLERIVDGDTIIVNSDRDRIRVRMIGIDTPESKKQGTPIEAYALQASSALKNLLADESEVCLIEDRVGDKYDTYDRKLSYVFRSDGKDLNAVMIKTGMAEAYTRFPMERKSEFIGYERSAKQAGVGQWE